MEKKRYIGVDIGGTAVKTGIIDEDGKVLVKSETPYSKTLDENVMQTVIRSIREISEDYRDISLFSGIGVSAAGSIDTKNGCVAINGGNVPDWGGTEVCRILRKEFGLPVSIANDANCVALAEDWTGAGKGCSDMICVTLGTGVGVGIISGGRLVEGNSGFGGEVGHIIIHAGGRKCDCGSRGCYERYASTSALVNEAIKVNEEWNSGRALFADAKAGNEEALRLIDAWTDEVAYGIASLVHIFNPKLVLIGGGVSAQEDLVIKPVEKKVKQMIMEDFVADLKIKRAHLGNDAGMVGAVRHLMNEQAV